MNEEALGLTCETLDLIHIRDSQVPLVIGKEIVFKAYPEIDSIGNPESVYKSLDFLVAL